MRAQLALLAVLSWFASGCGDLDTADRVHDLRLLAMRADPPEQELLLEAEPDGGATQPVTVTALVADPLGSGRSLHYAFATCAKLDSNNRCDVTAAGYQSLSEGELAGGVSSELSVTFTPSPTLLAAAVQLDPYKGFGGLPLPVQVTVTAGSETTVGYKLVVFTPRLGDAPVVPNTNPTLDGLDLGGQPWTDGGGTLTAATDGGDAVLPRFDATHQETYTRPKLDLSGEVTLTEAWRFHFFATAGSFSDGDTGGPSNPGNSAPRHVDSTWKPDDGMAATDVQVWVVVDDGRGGESWILRRAHYTP